MAVQRYSKDLKPYARFIAVLILLFKPSTIPEVIWLSTN
jgi:hypothetical protein